MTHGGPWSASRDGARCHVLVEGLVVQHAEHEDPRSMEQLRCYAGEGHE